MPRYLTFRPSSPALCSYQYKNTMPYLILSLLAISMALWAGAWSWGELLAAMPEGEIPRWEKTGKAVSPRAYTWAWQHIEAARQINPTRADHDLALGRLALLDPKATPQPAEIHFKHALLKRPSSGLAWSYLAMAVADDPAETDLFLKAISRSLTLEPYEAENQKLLIPLALQYREQLPPELQQRLEHIIQHGLRYQRGAIQAFTRKYHWKVTQ